MTQASKVSTKRSCNFSFSPPLNLHCVLSKMLICIVLQRLLESLWLHHYVKQLDIFASQQGNTGSHRSLMTRLEILFLFNWNLKSRYFIERFCRIALDFRALSNSLDWGVFLNQNRGIFGLGFVRIWSPLRSEDDRNRLEFQFENLRTLFAGDNWPCWSFWAPWLRCEFWGCGFCEIQTVDFSDGSKNGGGNFSLTVCRLCRFNGSSKMEGFSALRESRI